MSLKIIATGRRNPEAQGAEVMVLGADYGDARSLAIGVFDVPSGWDIARDIDVGAAVKMPVALRGEHGTLEWPGVAPQTIYLLSHPWSGVAVVSARGPDIDVDLYSPQTQVLAFDVRSGAAKPVDRQSAAMGAFQPSVDAGGASAIVVAKDAGEPAPPGCLAVRPLGRRNAKALGSDVVILSAEPVGLGVQVDLRQMASAQDWDVMANVRVGDALYDIGAKARSGPFVMSCARGGRIALLRNPWAGVVEIAYAEARLTVDLYADQPDVLALRAEDLAAMADVDEDDEDEAKVSAPAIGDVSGDLGVDGDEAAFYRARVARLDPDKPTALYVPRWKGVALSTVTLFEQSLPLPAGQTAHPDDVTTQHVGAYARMLVASGCKHFIVSGGDLFNLDIIEAVHELDDTVRFDQLWHSNYLQMGEEHDFNLLRHWVHALAQGKVTRIGVVKDGLEEWFKTRGIDAVSIPNVVPFDVDSVQPTAVNDSVGLWLSGSTQYRKMPHAQILAVAELEGVSLKASGLGDSARAVIGGAGVPFRRVWSEPLPRAQLHAEMARTGLTLYVTLSECSPMVPLESFALGVPCVVGPSSHLFRDHATLREMCVVERPFSPHAIADKARALLADPKAAFDAYKSYYAEELGRAQEGVARLVA